MSDYDRWRNEGDRYRGRNERDRDWDRGYGFGGNRYETDQERDRIVRGNYSENFGRGSRDYGGSPDWNRGSGYGEDRGGSGRSSEWRDDQRGGYGERGSSGFGWGGPDRDWRGRPDLAGRTSSELAFGRDASGRDYRSGHEQGRRYDRDERGWFERAGDEVASWFGDEDAERRRRLDAREDERYGGEHRGRGPKSYQRSDERIRDDVNDRLTDDYRLDASEIEVAVKDREVTLTGTVGNRADKRRAEDLVESVSGVTHVQNNLRVQNQYASGVGTSGHGLGQGYGSTSQAGSTGASRSPTGANQRSGAGSPYETAGAGTASGRGSRSTSKV